MVENYWSYQYQRFQLKRFNLLYEQHLSNLRLQGKRPTTIDGYSREVRCITAYLDKYPDDLTAANLKNYFNSLIQAHSWCMVKIDRNGLQFSITIPLE
ncbi:phage integrase N-terminal SAM-like domain-containing protein [Moritella sp. JT01]|uniref:phage integrase N-terminal SAM-like domain-containing protein n=1 Tax=Moritella sp. JT01 TaxID=756698 RepID=UPI0009FAEF5F|nr:phage integrase N-terminal SAM-like domain-containing protein [Moritella sp. JT01]